MLKKIIVIILLFLILILLISYYYTLDDPGQYDKLLRRIELPSKDFNIELYRNTEGGAYASDYFLIYKAYSDGDYDLIYSKKTNFLHLKFIKVNDDTVYLAEKYSIEEFEEKNDTLENGSIIHYFGNKLIGYKYDTLLLDLK